MTHISLFTFLVDLAYCAPPQTWLGLVPVSHFVPVALHCTFALVGDHLGVILRVAMIWSDFLNKYVCSLEQFGHGNAQNHLLSWKKKILKNI